MLTSYKRYKSESGGWGVPDFKDFRTRLAPLRGRNCKWTAADREYVETLRTAGAGGALWSLLSGNPTARELLGGRSAPEQMSKKALTENLESMISASRSVGWGPNEFLEYIEFLDGGLRVRDLRGPTAQGVHVDNTDPFIDMYRNSAEGVREHVRNMFRTAC